MGVSAVLVLLFPVFILGVCAIYAGVRLYHWASRRGDGDKLSCSTGVVGRMAETVGVGIALLGAFVLLMFVSAMA